jgi:antitoxin component of MazEF toxin-antitoxin module
MRQCIDDDETEVRLFNEILELTPERRKRLIEAIKTYEMIMENADEVLPIRKQ